MYPSISVMEIFYHYPVPFGKHLIGTKKARIYIGKGTLVQIVKLLEKSNNDILYLVENTPMQG